jgi:hypothetical protein
MVVHESFVTRKPLEFTIIVMVIVLILLLPVYVYTKNPGQETSKDETAITQSYGEVNYIFGPESDMSEADKKNLFKLSYENRFVQWEGVLLACDDMGGLFRVSIDHSGDGAGDVLFTTDTDCRSRTLGLPVSYRTRLIEWKIRTFIGKDGAIA